MSYKDSDKDGKIDIVRNGTDVDGDGDNLHEIIQTQDYYPFGLEIEYGSNHPNSLITGSNEHLYKYNGVELEEGLGLNLYEMDVRHYDPTIGRFTSIDPLGELIEQIDKSPYNFAWNNPILYSDPSGLCPECPDVSDYGAGDTYDINGVRYVVDTDGQWAREGGQLEEVVIGDTGTEDSASTEEDNSSNAQEANAGIVAGAIVAGELTKDISLGVSVTGGASATVGVGAGAMLLMPALMLANLAETGGAPKPTREQLQADLFFPLATAGAAASQAPIKQLTAEEQLSLSAAISQFAKDASANEKHGDLGRALEGFEKRLAELEAQLRTAKNKKEKNRIKTKIRRERQNAQKKKSGEEHSKANKR